MFVKTINDALSLFTLLAALCFHHAFLLLGLILQKLLDWSKTARLGFFNFLLSLSVFLFPPQVSPSLSNTLLLSLSLECILRLLVLLLLALLQYFNVRLQFYRRCVEYFVQACFLLSFSNFAVQLTLNLHRSRISEPSWHHTCLLVFLMDEIVNRYLC